VPDDVNRLYLVSPILVSEAEAREFAAKLEKTMANADVASLLLRVEAEADPSSLAPVVRLTERGGVALLAKDRLDLAKTSAFDGVHVTGVGQTLQEALKSLKPTKIVGAGALHGRDDAMVAGEAGADYVMFGDFRPGDTALDFERTRDLTAWWAEIFEPPCVAMAHRLADVERLSEAGADFVALGEALWEARLIEVAARETQQALARARKARK